MSLRARLAGWLRRGDERPLDADAPVELEDVWLHEGPILVSVLEQAGIAARGVESTSAAAHSTAHTRMRIFVPAGQLEQAAEALATYRAAEPETF